jgi:hypothetical protein
MQGFDFMGVSELFGNQIIHLSLPPSGKGSFVDTISVWNCQSKRINRQKTPIFVYCKGL